MEEVLRLTTAEEWELWLESLRVHLQAVNPASAPDNSIPLKREYRKDLISAIKVIQKCLDRFPKVAVHELVTEGGSRINEDDWVSLREQIRRHPFLGPRMEEFLGLWEFLFRYQVIATTLSRQTQISLSEYRAFSMLLLERIDSYMASKAQDFLASRHRLTKHRHMIHRNILPGVEIESVREELEAIFGELLRVLSTVQYIQQEMLASFEHHELGVLFNYCQRCYINLIRSLEQTQGYLDYCYPKLSEVFLGVRFGLNIETRRIFHQELKDIGEQDRLPILYSSMESALGLLTHASQQSFITLVRDLNPSFNEMAMFRDLAQMQTDSSRLLADLKELQQLAADPTVRNSDESFQLLLRCLNEFREGSMRFLFFKDWQPFDDFSEELEVAEPLERSFILHRFEVFVSTLIGEVGKRSVLTRSAVAREA